MCVRVCVYTYTVSPTNIRTFNTCFGGIFEMIVACKKLSMYMKYVLYVLLFIRTIIREALYVIVQFYYFKTIIKPIDMIDFRFSVFLFFTSA